MKLLTHPLHERGMEVAKEYKKNERELIEILQQMKTQDLFRFLGYLGATDYAIRAWGLSDDSAKLLVNVANLCERAPEVKAAIESGKLTLSKARRLAPVIKRAEDAKLWVERAMELSQKQLEVEVVRENPEVLIKEFFRPVFNDRYQFGCGSNEELKKRMERLKNLASAKLRKNASFEEILMVITELALEAMDPVKKAERIQNKKSKNPASGGLSHLGKMRSAEAYRQVNLRDRGKCQKLIDGKKCLSERFSNIHHIVEPCFGGKDVPENLITLCRHHHDEQHDFAFKKYARPSDELVFERVPTNREQAVCSFEFGQSGSQKVSECFAVFSYSYAATRDPSRHQ